MLTPREGQLEPYRLSHGPHLFTDWRFVDPGHVRWTGEAGREISLFATEGVTGNVYADPRDVPRNIQLVAQKARRAEPCLVPTEPWEHTIFWPTLIHDGGKYRLWYEVVPGDHWTGTATVPIDFKLLCYAESDDLVHWRKPALGIAEYHGRDDTNIVFGRSLSTSTGAGDKSGGLFSRSAAIFIDPSAESDERYKMTYQGYISAEKLDEYRRSGARGIDPMAEKLQNAMYAAVSPDGLHWRTLPEPIVVANSDTQNTAYYDPMLRKYVGYFRMWFYGRRVIGRAETDDFTRWPLPEPVLWAGPEELPSTDIYHNSKTVYPGTGTHHLMFPTMYYRDVDSAGIRMASSVEGKMWFWLPGDPVIGPGPRDSWDGGCIFAGHGMVSMPDGRVAQVCAGYEVPHKYPRSMLLGKIGLAWWPKGRLVAIETAGEGQFTTAELIFSGRRLLLNVETAHAGEVRVEVARRGGEALPGRSFSDADPISGNELGAQVAWGGEADLRDYAGQPVVLRLRLRAAKVFGFEFEEG